MEFKDYIKKKMSQVYPIDSKSLKASNKATGKKEKKNE
jgi:hypothetical protein